MLTVAYSYISKDFQEFLFFLLVCKKKYGIKPIPAKMEGHKKKITCVLTSSASKTIFKMNMSVQKYDILSCVEKRSDNELTNHFLNRGRDSHIKMKGGGWF